MNVMWFNIEQSPFEKGQNCLTLCLWFLAVDGSCRPPSFFCEVFYCPWHRDSGCRSSVGHMLLARALWGSQWLVGDVRRGGDPGSL